MLEALSKPVISETKTVEWTKKGKKHSKTTTKNISAAHILVFGLFAGFLSWRALRAAFGDDDGVIGAITDAAGGVVESVKDTAGGAKSYIETVSEYGIGFMMSWRGMSHNERATWRIAHGKPATWQPPGIPSQWV